MGGLRIHTMSSSENDNGHEQLLKLDEEGMPETGPYGGVEGGTNPGVVYPIVNLVMMGLGLLCAWGIYALSPKAYDAKILTLKNQDLGYLYLAVRVLTLVLAFQQVFVAVGRKKAKCDNPDQYVYKTQLRNDPMVRLVTKGPI